MQALLLCAFLHTSSAFSPFTVARSFSEHAVLQSAPASARVWGWTTPTSTVTTFLNCSALNLSTTFNVTPDADGLWIAEFPPVPASDHACVITFTDAASTASVWYLDILFGTVLLCLGQSNMDLPLSYIVNGTTSERDGANAYSTVRLLQVPLQAFSSSAASTPLGEFAALVPWARADNVSTASFSAECFLVARGLVDAARRANPAVDGIPVGAIQSDWPGDSIELLSSAAAIAQCGGPTARAGVGVGYPGPIPGPHFPSAQYNAMVAPLTVGPLRVSHFIYHQGEADVHTFNSTSIYECRLRALIADFRATLGAWDGAFFGISTLAPYAGDCGASCVDGVPAIRRAQILVGTTTPNASVAVATDSGDPLAPAGSVHSRRKQALAARLVAAAAAVQWGAASREGPAIGPLYARAADVSATAGALAADVVFSDASCPFGLALVFGINYTSTCPVGLSPTAPTIDECAWFALRGAASGWVNATAVEVLNATAIRLSAPGVADVAVGTAFGQSSYPVTVLFSGPLPVTPWSEDV